MKEIEVKILDINVEDIRKKLLDLGAEKVFEGEVEMYRFDYPDDRLNKEDSFLRIRKMGEQVELCFKGKKEGTQFKMREEIEVTTSGLNDTLLIFEKLGLKKIFDGKKLRESYTLGDVRFELDTYPGVPTFVAVEAPTEEEVITHVEKLGYSMNQTTTLSGFEVEREYKKNE